MQENNSKKTKQILVVIVGPTASGKTNLSLTLAEHFACPIISADSRQFFKEMNIGTAKPTTEEMRGTKHYFINSHSITEAYNVGKYENEVIELMDHLFETHETLILVGGSGLYVDAVCNGFDQLPEANPEIRIKIQSLLEEEGIEGLQAYLKKLDPAYYNQVDLQNPQRLSRALEICLTTGKTYSDLRLNTTKKRNFKCIKIGLTMPREALYERINLRVDQMMKDGLLNEVKNLQAYQHLNALQTVGYKELFDVFEEFEANNPSPEAYKKAIEKAVELIKQNTRRFAKRQLTWFRKDEQIKWFEPHQTESILSYITAIRNLH